MCIIKEQKETDFSLFISMHLIFLLLIGEYNLNYTQTRTHTLLEVTQSAELAKHTVVQLYLHTNVYTRIIAVMIRFYLKA